MVVIVLHACRLTIAKGNPAYKRISSHKKLHELLRDIRDLSATLLHLFRKVAIKSNYML